MVKLNLVLLYGGRSAEHEVSLRSAQSVFKALDKARYQICLVGIDKQGRWYRQNEEQFLSSQGNRRACVLSAGDEVVLRADKGKTSLYSLAASEAVFEIDLVFPILHGPMGEDGTVQGYLKLLQIPFVGCDVLASAVCMDKDVAKRLLRDANVPIADFLVMRGRERVNFAEASGKLGCPLFVKPANLGSSVGVSKAGTEPEYEAAVELAFRYDSKVIVEEAIQGREIECSVLGNEHPKASIPGEVVPSSKHGFYSYESKYLDDDGAELSVPAKLSPEVVERVRQVALRAYLTLDCAGMARVDFFVTAEGGVLVNEINTIPGFTSISMYPKLWEATGLPYRQLLDELIGTALHRRDESMRLECSL